MANCRARAQSSSICRPAATVASGFKTCFRTGTSNAARMPMMAMTTRSSTRVKAARNAERGTRNAERRFRTSALILFPTDNVVLVVALVGMGILVCLFVGAKRPHHDTAVVFVVVRVAGGIGGIKEPVDAGGL